MQEPTNVPLEAAMAREGMSHGSVLGRPPAPRFVNRRQAFLDPDLPSVPLTDRPFVRPDGWFLGQDEMRWRQHVDRDGGLWQSGRKAKPKEAHTCVYGLAGYLYWRWPLRGVS